MSDKKLLEKSPLSGIAVPIAIVLVGALIIFGVTRMLSSGKNHRDLVQELNSKTFGNRWVAAYELSKYLAASRIPVEDVPWVSENLIATFKQSVDARTRNFLILALAALNHPSAYPIFNQALDDADAQVRFNAVVALGNLPQGAPVEWERLTALLQSSDDDGLKQAILLAIAAHRHKDGQEWLRPYLRSEQKMLRYSAAMGLIHYKDEEATPALKEVLNLGYENRQPTELNGAQVEVLKINIIGHIGNAQAKNWLPLLESRADSDPNIKVATRAKEVVNLLKN
jgi:HEAT repeat protein